MIPCHNDRLIFLRSSPESSVPLPQMQFCESYRETSLLSYTFAEKHPLIFFWSFYGCWHGFIYVDCQKTLKMNMCVTDLWVPKQADLLTVFQICGARTGAFWASWDGSTHKIKFWIGILGCWLHCKWAQRVWSNWKFSLRFLSPPLFHIRHFHHLRNRCCSDLPVYVSSSECLAMHGPTHIYYT